MSRDNLGEFAAQVAGAALLMDYILTVAVSVSSGVAQITSAFPALFAAPRRRGVVLRRLRDDHQPARGEGVGRSSFAVPTYFFVVTMYADGRRRRSSASSTGTLGSVPDPPPLDYETPRSA